MIIREIREEDVKLYLKLLNQLDNETAYMLYEPGERRSTVEDIRLQIVKLVCSASLLLVAEEKEKLVGFLSADRGFASRIKHSCYIVVGILKDYVRKGLGTALFIELEKWAKSNKVIRLELTVMTNNEVAIHLYQKMGFKMEGIKEKSLNICGGYIDEYYMSKILM